jgi:hypothetical protein
MIEVSKKVGRYLKSTSPELCKKTSHNRHYYATECEQVEDLIAMLDAEKVVETYPPEVTGKKWR